MAIIVRQKFFASEEASPVILSGTLFNPSVQKPVSSVTVVASAVSTHDAEVKSETWITDEKGFFSLENIGEIKDKNDLIRLSIAREGFFDIEAIVRLPAAAQSLFSAETRLEINLPLKPGAGKEQLLIYTVRPGFNVFSIPFIPKETIPRFALVEYAPSSGGFVPRPVLSSGITLYEQKADGSLQAYVRQNDIEFKQGGVYYMQNNSGKDRVFILKGETPIEDWSISLNPPINSQNIATPLGSPYMRPLSISQIRFSNPVTNESYSFLDAVRLGLIESSIQIRTGLKPSDITNIDILNNPTLELAPSSGYLITAKKAGVRISVSDSEIKKIDLFLDEVNNLDGGYTEIKFSTTREANCKIYWGFTENYEYEITPIMQKPRPGYEWDPRKIWIAKIGPLSIGSYFGKVVCNDIKETWYREEEKFRFGQLAFDITIHNTYEDIRDTTITFLTNRDGECVVHYGKTTSYGLVVHPIAEKDTLSEGYFYSSKITNVPTGIWHAQIVCTDLKTGYQEKSEDIVLGKIKIVSYRVEVKEPSGPEEPIKAFASAQVRPLKYGPYLLAKCYIDWGITTNYDHETRLYYYNELPQEYGSGSMSGFGGKLQGLIPSAKYHYRVVCFDPSDLSNSDSTGDNIFQTPFVPLKISCGATVLSNSNQADISWGSRESFILNVEGTWDYGHLPLQQGQSGSWRVGNLTPDTSYSFTLNAMAVGSEGQPTSCYGTFKTPKFDIYSYSAVYEKHYKERFEISTSLPSKVTVSYILNDNGVERDIVLASDSFDTSTTLIGDVDVQQNYYYTITAVTSFGWTQTAKSAFSTKNARLLPHSLSALSFDDDGLVYSNYFEKAKIAEPPLYYIYDYPASKVIIELRAVSWFTPSMCGDLSGERTTLYWDTVATPKEQNPYPSRVDGYIRNELVIGLDKCYYEAKTTAISRYGTQDELGVYKAEIELGYMGGIVVNWTWQTWGETANIYIRLYYLKRSHVILEFDGDPPLNQFNGTYDVAEDPNSAWILVKQGVVNNLKPDSEYCYRVKKYAGNLYGYEEGVLSTLDPSKLPLNYKPACLSSNKSSEVKIFKDDESSGFKIFNKTIRLPKLRYLWRRIWAYFERLTIF